MKEKMNDSEQRQQQQYWRRRTAAFGMKAMYLAFITLSLWFVSCHAVALGPRGDGAPRPPPRKMVDDVFDYYTTAAAAEEEDQVYSANDHKNNNNKDVTTPAPTLIPTPRVTSPPPISMAPSNATTNTEYQQEATVDGENRQQVTSPTFAPFTVPIIPIPPIPLPPINGTASPSSATAAPSVVTSLAPTTKAPVQTGSPTTAAPIPIILPPIPTAAPSIAPTTTAPVTLAPSTKAPSTVAPTTVAPTTVAPTTAAPTASPTAAASTTIPTAQPTDAPREIESVEVTLSNVQVSFPGVTLITKEDFPKLGPIMETWFNDYFKNNSGGGNNSTNSQRALLRGSSWNERLYRKRNLQQLDLLVTDVESQITIISQDAQNGNTTVKYRQDLQYNAPKGIEPRRVAKLPFDNPTSNKVLAEKLRTELPNSFANLISPIGTPLVRGNEPTPSPSTQDVEDDDDGLSTGAIIGIAVGGAAAAILLVGGGGYYYSKKSSASQRPSERPMEAVTMTSSNMNNAQAELIPNKNSMATKPALVTQDIEKNQMVQSSSEMMEKETSSYAEKESVDTGEFEYANVAAQSMKGSEPGGSLGGEDATSKGDYSMDSDLQIDEDQYVIYAPAGRLGLVVDNPDDGAPVIHAIKDDSVLKDQVQVGDRLVGVDEVDVRSLSPVKVSKLISKRSTNPLRKLTLTRARTMGTDMDQKSQQESQAEQDTVDEDDVQNALGIESDSHTDAHTGMSQSDVDLGLDFPEEGSSVVDSMSGTGEMDEQEEDALAVKAVEESLLGNENKDP